MPETAVNNGKFFLKNLRRREAKKKASEKYKGHQEFLDRRARRRAVNGAFGRRDDKILFMERTETGESQ